MVVGSNSKTPFSVLSRNFMSAYMEKCVRLCVLGAMTEDGTSPSGRVYLTEIVFNVCMRARTRVCVCVAIWERRVSGGQH